MKCLKEVKMSFTVFQRSKCGINCSFCLTYSPNPKDIQCGEKSSNFSNV